MAGLGQKIYFTVHVAMSKLYPQTSLNELCKADKRRYELTVLIYKHCDLGFVLQHWPNANVLLIKLDRPHKKNAFKLAMFGEIKRGL